MKLRKSKFHSQFLDLRNPKTEEIQGYGLHKFCLRPAPKAKEKVLDGPQEDPQWLLKVKF